MNLLLVALVVLVLVVIARVRAYGTCIYDKIGFFANRHMQYVTYKTYAA